ncbi:unnamed protein product [marine sediment metagenome]|uniref:Uncharacterized protein n=1 Tax=marine sediment metagenome TaxID=412755 RepID=X0RYH3_9ZZZZ
MYSDQGSPAWAFIWEETPLAKLSTLAWTFLRVVRVLVITLSCLSDVVRVASSHQG